MKINKNIPENPFSSATYLGKDFFCDRTEETQLLIRNIQNGNSTTLIAVRRIGKTGLIQHVLSHLPKNYKSIYIDILETENLNQFLNLLATSIVRAIPEKNSTGRKFWNFIKALRPVIKFDILTGEPIISFDIKYSEVETNINSVIEFLESQNFKVVIAIDEFQQILNYPEKNTDAWLRSKIQQLKNIVFIFAGSEQHLMTELFTSPKRPFFRSSHILKLKKIDKSVYRDFIISLFDKYGKIISSEIAEEILTWANVHTFYVQQLCNRVFSFTKNAVTTEIWKKQAYLLLKEQENVFFACRNMLTNPQWNLLKAIAHEGNVFMPTAKEFLNQYQLGTSATVLRSLNTLIDYELVYYDYDENGRKYYSVYDVWFQRWIEIK
jgi:hypothetical protein